MVVVLLGSVVMGTERTDGLQERFRRSDWQDLVSG